MALGDKPFVLLGGSDREVSVVLAGILKLRGIHAVVASSSDEFLDLLNKHQAAVDLVCVNGKLASERGGLLISRTRDTGRNIKIVVVADRDDERADILRYGADEFLQKPISPDAVVNKIIALVAKS
jgi:DNA-binding response OmpR family regulator